MLKRLNKLAPYLVLGLLGYLTYSSMGGSAAKLAQGKDVPIISKIMLSPVLMEPREHSSPADRDPFMVSWSTYQTGEPAVSSGVKAARLEPSAPSGASPTATGGPQSQPASSPAPATQASQPGPAQAPPLDPPPLPQKLGAVFISQNLRKALIDEVLYSQGQDLPGTDDGRCWVVERIEQNCVVLRFAGAAGVEVRQTLHLPGVASEKSSSGWGGQSGSSAPPRREGAR